MSVYQACPVLTTLRFTLRLVSWEDAPGLLRVYSDEKAWPLFNADNCHYGAFRMTNLADMERSIALWLDEYAQGNFVRWTILTEGDPIGTVELFHRIAEDALGDHGLLRLDLRSDWETTSALTELLDLLAAHAYDLFDCDALATKAIPLAAARREALAQCGWQETGWADYWVRRKGLRGERI